MSILQQVPAKMQMPSLKLSQMKSPSIQVSSRESENLPGVRWRKSSSSVGWKTQRRVISTSLKPLRHWVYKSADKLLSNV